jgi:hypothetical protein
MHSSTSSSDAAAAWAGPAPAERVIPERSWAQLAAASALIALLLLVAWEWHVRGLGLMPGDLGDFASDWAEARREVGNDPGQLVILGDSRLLFGTDLGWVERLTGRAPVQLSMPGTNAQFLLEQLAADPDFRGVALVSFSEDSSFTGALGPRALQTNAAFETFRFESPASRSGHVLHRALSRQLAFLDDNYRLSVLIRRLDRGARIGAPSPYFMPWKTAVFGDRRNGRLWSRVEVPGPLNDHVIAVWLRRPPALLPEPQRVQEVLDRASRAVAAIRARGGDVIYVRPPTNGPLYERQRTHMPRNEGWDRLVGALGVAGVHFEDVAAMQGLDLPEYSHVSSACARVFTDAMIRAVAERIPRVHLKPDAPPLLGPADCARRSPD